MFHLKNTLAYQVHLIMGVHLISGSKFVGNIDESYAVHETDFVEQNY